MVLEGALVSMPSSRAMQKIALMACVHALPGQAVPTALRGAFQSCGQNCAGAERFLVHARVYQAFLDAVTEATRKLRQGPALGPEPVDCSAMCMPGLAEKVAALVDEAVADGAQVCMPPLSPSFS
jgi:acyl-CoA reductase-like NAD-dependent aldehyde dehydrogenase